MTINKDIVLKISPIAQHEELFINALRRCKSDICSRDLAFSFMSDDTNYAEAQALAEAAILWVEEATNQYRLFAKNCNFEINISEDEFLDYCESKCWATKRCGGEITARDKSGKMKALFKDPKSMHVKLDNPDALSKMQFLNELEVS